MQSSVFSLPLPKDTSQQKYWGGLCGSSQAFAIADTAVTHQGPILVVTPDTPSALKLEQELRYFTRDNQTLETVTVFPDWETLPYDTFSPHQDIVSQRIETLYQLSQNTCGIYIVPVNTLMMRLAPTHYLAKYTLLMRSGDILEIEKLRQQLDLAGYHAVTQVMSHGEFSIRGSIIDIYPTGSKTPYRIDLFDDEVDSIRLFDPDTQRSSDKINEIKLLPAHEFPTDKEGIATFKQQFLAQFEDSTMKDSLFYQVTRGGLPGGIEYYLPLFFEETATFFDYLHENTLMISTGDLQDAAQHYWSDVEARYEQYRYDKYRPLLSPQALFLRFDELFAQLKHLPRITLYQDSKTHRSGYTDVPVSAPQNVAIKSQSKSPYGDLQQQLTHWMEQGTRIMFCAESVGRKESLLELLAKASIKPSTYPSLQSFLASDDKVGVSVGLVEDGFMLNLDNCQLALLTENALIGHKISQRRRRHKATATDEDAVIRNLAELTVEQPVVHIEHGVGRYLGLQTLDVSGIPTEFLTLEYAKQAKLYVPVSSLHLISRYSGGDPDQAPMNTLGNDTWSKAKAKAAEKIRDVAAKLLDVYAKRAAKPGQAHTIDWQEYTEFSNSFPFEETLDQEQAINAVLNDMGSPKAMDRLVCGDVGFGKTEVAMRAAFVAASQGQQVAVLVPTTLLAQQHYQNFCDRFADWPFKIEVLSRFKTAKQQKEALAALEAGTVDIIIGTHKLIQDDVKYQSLGLVIIDEEHRFGVRQKEKFKTLRADVDILTLTATPIPRTLNMSLTGMRDLSIIATPPAKRLAIKTFVKQRDEQLIREAVMREILRGGQVYFLHNEVDSIDATAREIEEIVPEARICVAHGQMREKELESVMSDFYHQKHNVLVCTTIIETGIDVPSANTIIMDRADHLGLAQLHQLRGRVGRSHHQAYAYLLTPHPKRMTKDATKRLDAISSLENLGAGFTLATHDLEIRGAGELLGDEQSGQISTIGFTLYMDMLDKAVTSLKEGKEIALGDVLSKQTDIELRVPALLPEDYVPDVNLRLSLYKKIASCKNNDDIKDIKVELIDRFGLLPNATKHLIAITELKLIANKLGIKRIDGSPQGGSIEFAADTPVDPSVIIKLIQTQSSKYRLEGAQKLKYMVTSDTYEKRLKVVSELLGHLSQRTKAA